MRTPRIASLFALPVSVALLTVAFSTGSTYAATQSPARGVGSASGAVRLGKPAAGTIKAEVVKSWGKCSGGSLVWDDLNANWSNYGSTPIQIVYDDPTLCNTTVTLAALKASAADVVILSDPAGGIQQFSADEVKALKAYAALGHNVIGTYLTLAFPIGGIDNRKLASLFGLSKTAGYGGGDQTVNPLYNLKKPDLPLFKNVPNPYQSLGFNEAQTPTDGAWSRNEKTKGKYLAFASSKQGAIVFFSNGIFDGILITNMPEYGGGTADKQFIYNAIIEPPGQ